jgi:hypothetical protein
MGVTRLQRKVKRNFAKAVNKNKYIKQLCAKPVIRKVDVEAIKKEFEAKKAAAK